MRIRTGAVVAGVLALMALACASDPTSDDSLPYWFAVVEGTLSDADGVPVSEGWVEWRHRSPDCETSPALEHAAVAVDADGGYRVDIQVETADGCFELIGTVSAGDTARVVLSSVDLPLAQEPRYDTVFLPLQLQ